jgi:hypothetical protein
MQQRVSGGSRWGDHGSVERKLNLAKIPPDGYAGAEEILGLARGGSVTNIVELKSALEDAGFRFDGYRVLEAPDESAWCIKKQGKTWLVFYFERGTRWEMRRFKEESVACEYFYNRIVHG